MKHFLHLLIILLVPCTTYSQAKTWYWSIRKCEISNADDSSFLVNIEKRMWKASLTPPSFPVYEGFFGGGGYRIRMSKAAAEERFSDTTVRKVQFLNSCELATLWNYTADTCMIISFEPNCGLKSTGNKRFSSEYALETFCWVHIPLFYYETYLNKIETERLKRLTLSAFAHQFNAGLIGDTLFRIVNFRSDSNEYLRQASYKHLGELMKDAMLAGQLGVYPDYDFTRQMTKRQLEESFVHWDSTNAIEDPTRPGTYVFAPIKIEEQPVGLVIYEKWVPVKCEKQDLSYYFYPQPYMQYRREVISYGLRLTSGKINWTVPVQFYSVFRSSTFNLDPYEECFRSERFERMHISLEP